MSYRILFILIEGEDDERFFKNQIEPILLNKYDMIKLWTYAKKPKKKIKQLLNSINAMGAKYIFTADNNNSPCITHRREAIKRAIPLLNDSRISIVVEEIESWYLAGLDDREAKDLIRESFNSTDHITKEMFNSYIPSKYDSRIDFMIEILKRYSIEIAKGKNRSFNYFKVKFL